MCCRQTFRLILNAGFNMNECHDADKDWESATRIQKAFAIGSKEAASVSNLQLRISKKVVAQLRNDVRSRGMTKWLSHELLSRDLFNQGFSSGTGCYDAWSEQLTNSATDELDPCMQK